MSTAIAVRDVAELEQILQTNELGAGVEVVEDPEQTSREIIEQLLNAASDEELQNVGTATSWRELLGVPMQLISFNWRPSAYEEGSRVFFVVKAYRLDEGEHVVLTTGARNVLAQIVNLYKREQLGRTDCVWRLVEGSKTAAGFVPLWLEKVAGQSEKAK